MRGVGGVAGGGGVAQVRDGLTCASAARSMMLCEEKQVDVLSI